MALRNELVQYAQRAGVLPANRVWAYPPVKPELINSDGSSNAEDRHPSAQIGIQNLSIVYDLPGLQPEPTGQIIWTLVIQGREQIHTEETAEDFMFKINRRGMFRSTGGLRIRDTDVTSYSPAAATENENPSGWQAEITFESSVEYAIR